MIITSFDNDLLGLQPFAKRLQSFIDVEHQFVDGSLVIALSSKFGSGKTTFLQMWKATLESQGEERNTPLVISLNAWESDYYGDPLFAVVSGLVDHLQKNGQSANSIVDAAKDFGWFVTAISGQIVQKVTGIDAIAAGDLAEKQKVKRDGAERIPKDTFSVYQGRKDAMCKLKKAVREFVTSTERKVLFFVDELDRCRPDYAITYLETIKHVFDVRGAVFILAADRHQLENSAKTAFGRDLDFEEYYRKFVHREVTLPPISDSGYMKLARAYVDYYLQRDGLRNCFMEIGSSRIDEICQLMGALRLTPRQMQEVFRILGHIFETSEKNKGRLLWCLAVGSIAMATFKVGNPKVFHLLGTQQFEPKAAFDFLKGIYGDSNIAYWFMLFLSGGGLKVNKGQTAQDVMTQVGLIEKGKENTLMGHFGQLDTGWGYSSVNRFTQIYEKIEQVLQWE